MIQPKYKIDEQIFIPFRVTGIAIENRKGEERILYRVSSPGDTASYGGNRELYEDEMPEGDYILAEVYEAEVNALKDEVKRWREEYNEEHARRVLAERPRPKVTLDDIAKYYHPNIYESTLKNYEEESEYQKEEDDEVKIQND